MAQKERIIERTIINYLRAKGFLVSKIRSTGRFVQGRMIPLPEDERGVSDLIACYQGKYIAIEIKAGNGRQTEYQKAFESRVKESGGIYLIARSIQDIDEFLLRPLNCISGG